MSHHLQAQFEKLSITGKSVCLILFLFVCSASFVYIIASSLNIRSPVFTRVEVSKLPGFVHKMPSSNRSTKEAFVYKEQRRIDQFRKYMDSLSRTASGTRIKDSIKKVRPGLMDSLAKLERILKNTSTN